MKTFELYTSEFSCIIQATNILNAVRIFYTEYNIEPIACVNVESPLYKEFIETDSSKVPLVIC